MPGNTGIGAKAEQKSASGTLPDWLRPRGASGTEWERAATDWRADARGFAASVLGTCFYDRSNIPDRHYASLDGIWRSAALPFNEACAAVCDPGLSLEFFRGYGGVPPSLRVPYYAALLGARASDGRAAEAASGWRGFAAVPDAVSIPYGAGGEVRAAADADMDFYGTGRALFQHRESRGPSPDADARPDGEVAELAARHFRRDGGPKDPAALARMCVEEARALRSVREAEGVGPDGLAAAISEFLSRGWKSGVPSADCLVAARAATAVLGKEVGKFAGYLAEISASGCAVYGVGVAVEDDFLKRGETVVAATRGPGAALHKGALYAVGLAVLVAETDRWMAVRAMGMLGPTGRRLLSSAA